MRAQLAELLDYIAMLDEVDTSKVEPTAQVLAQTNVLRADTARPSLTPPGGPCERASQRGAVLPRACGDGR